MSNFEKQTVPQCLTDYSLS